jgi:hypothetical protein
MDPAVRPGGWGAENTGANGRAVEATQSSSIPTEAPKRRLLGKTVMKAPDTQRSRFAVRGGSSRLHGITVMGQAEIDLGAERHDAGRIDGFVAAVISGA